MRLPIVDCRSLIQFCRAFDQHQNKTRNKKQPTSASYDAIKNNNKNKKPSCNTSSSPFAILDVLILILVLTSLGYLVLPYINILLHIVLPYISDVIYDVVYDAPIAYVIGAVSAFSGVIGTLIVYDIFVAKSRKCGRKDCRGLRKAVEFDIQLESEECVKYELVGLKRWLDFDVVVPLELGEGGGGYKEELEAELRKMAPVNGRTVLIFREKCGCPKGRLEVWGAKRVRRIKK